MQTLDFGAIIDKNEAWYEDYDLTCPYCHGEGEYDCDTCGGEGSVECPECAGFGIVADRECQECEGIGDTLCEDCDDEGKIYCEQCSDGQFEVMWNTAYEVKVWDDYLDVDRDSPEWQEAYKLAWDNGFCLIEHGTKQYLLMGMCGQDCTWLIHYTRWKLQGFLDLEDCQQCIGSGGYVFLRDQEKRRELCEYIRGRLTPPEDYARSYAYDIAKIDRAYLG